MLERFGRDQAGAPRRAGPGPLARGTLGAVEEGREPILDGVDVGRGRRQGALELGHVLGQVGQPGVLRPVRAHLVGPGLAVPEPLLALLLGVG